MFDDCMTIAKMNNDKSKEDYDISNSELNKKCFIAWSPIESNKFSSKHRYVSCSRSVPHRSKRLARYRMSRSLNFDTSSNSENSSFEENKYLSRSAKIMRALNFNSSPSYYGKTKIKRSLNFNLTPSPKRFMALRKSTQKSSSKKFNSPLNCSNKVLNFDDNGSDSANNSLLFSSSESIDENQNETLLQQNTKLHEALHYSTPNTKLTRRSLCSVNFKPLSHSQLKETIDSIVYISAATNSRSLKYVRGRSKCINNVAMNTSRNLFHEFHDKDDNRPCTPENLIRIVPESMSAIKRSHKKERLSKWSERCMTEFTNDFINVGSVLEDRTEILLSRQRKHSGRSEESKSGIIDQYNTDDNSDSTELTLSQFEDDVSDTGSLFDYTEEQKHALDESKNVFDSAISYASVVPKIRKSDIKIKSEGNAECFSEIESLDENKLAEDHSVYSTNHLFNWNIGSTSDARAVTPEPVTEVALELQKSVTPENRINILQRIATDSIKKSRKKTKDDNRKRLFSPEIQVKIEASGEQKSVNCSQNFENHENSEDNETAVQNYVDTSKEEERSRTPEKVNSSRLLLSQFSSVKKSHKKDKLNKILSGFLKRQEYFNNRDIDLTVSSKYKACNVDDMPECRKNVEDFSSDSDVSRNIGDTSSSEACIDMKLSPSKRKKLLDASLDCDTSVSCNPELQESDASKEEFKIFTPLKRKRASIVASTITGNEYLHPYDLPCVKTETLEETVADINFSRCLTPVSNLLSNRRQTEENDEIMIISDCSINDGSAAEIHDIELNDITGRSTPRNMSTAELYFDLGSIKKSHKKNKRGNNSRKSSDLIGNNCCVDEKSEASIVNIESGTCNNTLELSNDPITIDDVINNSINDKLVDQNEVVEDYSSFVTNNKNCSSPGMENILSTTTPPNCLKTKNYMELLRGTSIKRSHKKIRDKRKQEITVETDELSDDGSIFGDGEKIIVTED